MKTDTAIILAGGKSTRMGFDKQKIKIGGKLIVDYLAEKLDKHFSQIIIVTKTPDLYKGKPYTLCQDYYKNCGPLAGIHAGLKNTKSQAAYIMACDMPNINDAYIEYIVEKFESTQAPGLVTDYDTYIEPLAAIYSKSLLPLIEKKLEAKDLKIKKLIEEQDFIKISKEEVENFDPELKIFKNLNYQEDLEEIL